MTKLVTISWEQLNKLRDVAKLITKCDACGGGVLYAQTEAKKALALRPPRCLTEEELRDLAYFWNEKKDITRYVKWEELQASLQTHHPEIIKAWDKYVKAEQKLTDLFKDH